jgi:transcriptional regulator with PAS, ATPase and Fis domain
MQEIYQRARKLARDGNITVLIRGESGTGKELLARAIHSNSPRSECPFIPVDCASLPEGLLESELFGHEKGAFTGALQRRLGKFELAHSGSIFLDEIGNIPKSVQVKLLRVLQEREFYRVGGTSPIKIDVRVIAATNINLERAVDEGTFREDLYYRLSVVPIFLPPLRERKEDIPLLVEYFIQKFSEEKGEKKRLSAETLKILCSYDWPGNVRELENVIERLFVLSDGATITQKHLPDEILSREFHTLIPEGKGILRARELLVKEFEQKFILKHLRKNKGNISKTAREIGLSREALHRKIKMYKIRV